MEEYMNIKNGNIYKRMSKTFINATNGPADGQVMVGYFSKNGQLFVREINEFNQKFKLVK
jgi:hypothetical protein